MLYFQVNFDVAIGVIIVIVIIILVVVVMMMMSGSHVARLASNSLCSQA